MDTKYIEELETLDLNHFWFKAKAKYLESLINKPEAVILDVGCGSGGNMTSFIERDYKVIGIDINEQAIAACRKKGYTVIKANLEKEIPDIHCTPDYITAFDFFEHIHNPVNVLENLRKLACPETQLIVTVPSYQSLFSKWDEAMGHVKRYRRLTLCNELSEGGWDVLKSTYIHMIPLFPAFLIRKLIQPLVKLSNANKKVKGEKFFTVPPFFNNLVYHMYLPEFLCFQRGLSIPFGLSILTVAKPRRF
jgi:SAM-dependent methyltransferase